MRKEQPGEFDKSKKAARKPGNKIPNTSFEADQSDGHVDSATNTKIILDSPSNNNKVGGTTESFQQEVQVGNFNSEADSTKNASREDQELQMVSKGIGEEDQVEIKEGTTDSTLKKKTSMRRKALKVDVNEKRKLGESSPGRSLKSPGSPGRALYLLKLAKSSHISGDKPSKTVDYASRAAKIFEKSSPSSRPSLELVMSFHIIAAAQFRMGRYQEAVEALEKTLQSLESSPGKGDEQQDPVESEYLLAAFAGYMQLGDAYSRLGRQGKALESYSKALDVQKRAYGEMDPQVGETCRYLAEAYLQAMRFNEAEEHCEQLLRIHAETSPAGCMEEAVDRRLMALIKSGKGEHEAALEHLILASTALSSKVGQSAAVAVASMDASIGDCYSALGRYEEAVFSYQKALSACKQLRGENHVSVASVYVSLGELAVTTGKLRDAKSYCESALRIYGRQQQQQQQQNQQQVQQVKLAAEEVAAGLTDMAGVYEAMNEREQAVGLLQRALDTMQKQVPGEKRAAAGIEAQMGVLYYIMGDFERALSSLSNSVSKLKAGGGGEEVISTPSLGVLLNQMGLVLFELGRVEQAVDVLEEAKVVLVEACGVHHPDTVAVCSNLAGGYDALGRVDDAIDMLDRVVRSQEERLGTVHPEVVDQRLRLEQMARESGKPLVKRTSTLEELLMLQSAQSKRYHHRLVG